MVKAGYARPGQTVEELLDSFALDMILTYFWGALRENRSDKEVAELDATLYAAENPDAARAERAAANMQAMSKMKRG